MKNRSFRSGVRRLGTQLLCGCPWPLALTGAGVLALGGIAVRSVCGSPYRFGVMLHFADVLPSVPLMTALWTVWYALLGATFCIALLGGRQDACARAEKYRGGMLFLAMIFLGFLWYPLFFSAGRTVLCALLLGGVLALCILTALCWLRVCRTCGVVMLVHAVYLGWLLALSVALLFV